MRVLIADDDFTSRKVLESKLKKWGFEIVSVSDGEKALHVLRCEKDIPRLVILDWMMPGMDGIEVCKKIRQQHLEDYIYIILLTAKGDKEDVIRGLEAGADDYIIKPFYPHELKARINAGKRIVDLQSQLNVARESLRFQATHDPLTKMLNRRAITDILEREVSRAYRYKKPVSLLMLDLDHFKKVNDNYGHLTGDEVLCKVSIRISSVVRDYDSLGRYGGEEFVVVLPNCDSTEGLNVAERIRRCVEETPIKTKRRMITITISVGVAVFTAGEKIAGRVLIHAADSALYRAKNSGRNRVELAALEDYEEFPSSQSS